MFGIILEFIYIYCDGNELIGVWLYLMGGLKYKLFILVVKFKEAYNELFIIYIFISMHNAHCITFLENVQKQENCVSERTCSI